jgi:hypothetical protein
MPDFLIAIGYVRQDGRIERESETFAPSDFGGVVPSIGDRILKSGVTQRYRAEKIDFDDPSRRTFWIVKERIFRPDMPGCVLVCDDQQATDRESDLL